MANLHKFIPPSFADQTAQRNIAIFIFLEETRSANIKYAEQRIIVEVVYVYIGWSDDGLSKSINVSEKSTCLMCGDLDPDAVWPSLPINGEQMVGMILVGK